MKEDLSSYDKTKGKSEGSPSFNEISSSAKDLEKVVIDKQVEIDEVVLFGDEDQSLRQLTGAPHWEDEVLFAIPFCAPYTSLHPNYYKYRSKLIPGAMKRGKSTKSILTAFINASEPKVNSEKRTSTQRSAGDFPANLDDEEMKIQTEDQMRMKLLEHQLLQAITDDEAIKTMFGDTRIVSTTVGVGTSKTAITTNVTSKSSKGKVSSKKGAKNRGRKGK